MAIGSGACGAVQAVRVTILLLAVTACGTDRITTPDHAVSADADGWSGGTLLLRSAAFVGADSVPLIVVVVLVAIGVPLLGLLALVALYYLATTPPPGRQR